MMKGWSVAEFFVEAGVSGSVPLADRPGGQRLLTALQPGDVIITAKLDRAFRSAADALGTAVQHGLREIDPGDVVPVAQQRDEEPPGPDAELEDLLAEIETIQRGQAAAKSLSNVGGAAGDTITPEALANMSDDEFRALFDRLSTAKQREMLGG